MIEDFEEELVIPDPQKEISFDALESNLEIDSLDGLSENILKRAFGEEVTEDITTPIAKRSFIIQQCTSPAQVMDMLIKFYCTHFSGCFFTTIVNNIVHELYLRYVFAVNCPNLVFEHHVRAKLCGDDHIYSFSDVCKEFMTPHKIRDGMEELGQVYTSDIKDQPLEDRFRRFEEITFLGAHPVLVEGQYSGALKKATIEECLHWTPIS